MKKEKLQENILNIEKEIAILPIGNLTTKTINGKKYHYLRVSKNGKRHEEYISPSVAEELRPKIEKRKKLEKELKALELLNKNNEGKKEKLNFKTIVRINETLRNQVNTVKKYKKRKCYQELKNYINDKSNELVFIIYGLRRTGKTTLIRQAINELDASEFARTAFIQITAKDSLDNLNHDLQILEENGYKYVFIDEITLMEEFVENASLLSDIYAISGMKIVLSGTDSLGFIFSKDEQLYDRCVFLHTTFIPYKEFEEVLGKRGIDEYIKYGGTMSLSGINYNKNSIFSNADSTNEYVDTAIARNIQHSLKTYQNGSHFRQLIDLYESNELTNVINRVVENINHRFTCDVIEKTFKSSDISLTASNLLRDKNTPINIKEHLDLDEVTKRIMDDLEIINKQKQKNEINPAHMIQIEEYLLLLDLIKNIDLEYLPQVNEKGKITVIAQPGLRYSQAEVIVKNILEDNKFLELEIEIRNYILDRLLSEIKGRMMEEIVLLETSISKSDKKVFKLQFAVGEFDMVVLNEEEKTCEIYEIKHSKEATKQQYQHLINKDKCDLTTKRFGEIKGKYVIYRGQNKTVDGIQYINVEEYLKSIYN